MDSKRRTSASEAIKKSSQFYWCHSFRKPLCFCCFSFYLDLQSRCSYGRRTQAQKILKNNKSFLSLCCFSGDGYNPLPFNKKNFWGIAVIRKWLNLI